MLNSCLEGNLSKESLAPNRYNGAFPWKYRLNYCYNSCPPGGSDVPYSCLAIRQKRETRKKSVQSESRPAVLIANEAALCSSQKHVAHEIVCPRWVVLFKRLKFVFSRKLKRVCSVAGVSGDVEVCVSLKSKTRLQSDRVKLFNYLQ